jgi:hypothetical protein
MATEEEIKLVNEERIDRYLRDEMSQLEKSVFEVQLFTDKTLRQQAIAIAQMVKVMSTAGRSNDRKLKQDIMDDDTEFVEAYASPLEEINVDYYADEDGNEDGTPQYETQPSHNEAQPLRLPNSSIKEGGGDSFIRHSSITETSEADELSKRLIKEQSNQSDKEEDKTEEGKNDNTEEK